MTAALASVKPPVPAAIQISIRSAAAAETAVAALKDIGPAAAAAETAVAAVATPAGRSAAAAPTAVTPVLTIRGRTCAAIHSPASAAIFGSTTIITIHSRTRPVDPAAAAAISSRIVIPRAIYVSAISTNRRIAVEVDGADRQSHSRIDKNAAACAQPSPAALVVAAAVASLRLAVDQIEIGNTVG